MCNDVYDDVTDFEAEKKHVFLKIRSYYIKAYNMTKNSF